MRGGRHRTSRRVFLLGGLALALPARALGGRRELVSEGRGQGRRGPQRARADTLISRDEPLLPQRAGRAGFRLLEPRRAPRFSTLGLHWRGAGEVWFRSAGADRVFGEWERAACCESPDEDSDEPAPRRGWHFGKPAYTDDAEWVQYRLRGEVRALRAHFLWTATRSLPRRRLAIADGPAIIPRSAWRANERIVRARPYYAERLELAVVHHTAGRRPNTPRKSAELVAAIQRYHVKANGWNDIGYNFLVDPFGQVFEGRRGGAEANVVGAHARGFNRGAVGVALIGDYHKGEPPTPEALAALAALLAWRLDVAHLDPATLRSLTSGGTSRHPRNSAVTLRSVSGHRDTDFTSCPGRRLYRELDGVAVAAAQTGLPKLYDPATEGTVGGPVRFTGRLSEELPWVVTVTDPAGSVVGKGPGHGSAIDWTWDATPALGGGPYAYAITAGEPAAVDAPAAEGDPSVEGGPPAEGDQPAEGAPSDEGDPPAEGDVAAEGGTAPEGEAPVGEIAVARTVRPASGLVAEPPPPPDPDPLPTPPPKPKGVPKRVPSWAWQMYRWHDKPRRNRGPRPDAPKRLPRWYWKWRKWRRRHARIAELIRIRREAGDS